VDAVVGVTVVVPPLSDPGCGVARDEPEGAIPELLDVILERDREREAVPSRPVGDVGRCVAEGARARERRRESREGGDVLAVDLGGRLPVVKRESDGDLLLE